MIQHAHDSQDRAGDGFDCRAGDGQAQLVHARVVFGGGIDLLVAGVAGMTFDPHELHRAGPNSAKVSGRSSSSLYSDKLSARALAGIFGIGQHPKGDKDPFALRRAALGVLRIIVEKNLDLDLQTLTEEAVRLYGEKLTNANVVDDVIDFMLGRFRAWYQDEGYGVDTIQAVLARRPTRPADFDARMKAVSHFRTLEESSALAAANKRVSNILAKSDETLNDIVHASVLKEAAEIKLAGNLVVLRDKLQPYFAAGRYQDALIELAALREPVDEFFENVMVNAEDKDVRINRLTLLSKLRELFLQVADISLLQ